MPKASVAVKNAATIEECLVLIFRARRSVQSEDKGEVGERAKVKSARSANRIKTIELTQYG